MMTAEEHLASILYRIRQGETLLTSDLRFLGLSNEQMADYDAQRLGIPVRFTNDK